MKHPDLQRHIYVYTVDGNQLSALEDYHQLLIQSKQTFDCSGAIAHPIL